MARTGKHSLTRSALMGGASFLALAMGSNLRAHAAGTTITGPNVSFSVTTAQSFDFVLIDNATITNNVTNSGTIGMPVTSPVGLAITDSTVGGGVINQTASQSGTASILATQIGILVEESDIGDGIVNNGLISVDAAGSVLTSNMYIAGVGVSGVAVDTSFDNNNDLYVEITGAGTQANADIANPFAGVGYGVYGNDSVNVDFANTGDFEVHSTFAGNGMNVARASGVFIATGVALQVTTSSGGPSELVTLTNTGDFDVVARATDGSYNYAYAGGMGVWISSSTAPELEITGSNSSNGSIDILAFAEASQNTTVEAEAGAAGLYLKGHGADEVYVGYDNDGHFSVIADAMAEDADYAKAVATVEIGVVLSAGAVAPSSGPGYGTIAEATFTNSSPLTLDVEANASASAYYKAEATAYITEGLAAWAQNAETAQSLIENDGTINIAADAYAKAYYEATAQASVFSGITQWAEANAGSQDTASAYLYNDGDINIGAYSKAESYDEDAYAYAKVSDGIAQYADDGQESWVTLDNMGNLSINAYAKADADEEGYATAEIFGGIYQKVSGADAQGSTGSATLTNTSEFSLDIRAYSKADAYDAEAEATIEGGIYQKVDQSADSDGMIDNSGDMEIVADAYAKGYYASAEALVDDGIWQSIDADGNELASHATIINTGDLWIGADASAEGYYAYAKAEVYDGIVQQAYDGNETIATITNEGSLYIKANADADGGTFTSAYDAYAKAIVETGIGQSAEAGGQDLASTVFTNTSDLSLYIQASAQATGEYANAKAILDDGLWQYAKNADTATALIDNDGYVAIGAYAEADADTAEAYAKAIAQSAVFQKASAIDDGTLAEAQFTNTGEFNIYATAEAYAYSDYASAEAYNKYAFGQDVEDGHDSIARLDNDGHFGIYAKALASADSSDNARAFASVEEAIWQNVDASGEVGSTASAVITNTSDLTLEIGAYAKAYSEDGNAYATAYNKDAIEQYADYADEATALIDNDGLVDIYAIAEADGYDKGYAKAIVTDAVEQSADADVSEILSSVTLENDGSFYIRADASALSYGVTGGTYESAYAKAAVIYGISQDAYDGELSTATITNHGDLHIIANAYAGPATSAEDPGLYAKAYVKGGIDQHAYGDQNVGDIARVTLTNTSDESLIIGAFASANGIIATTATGTTGADDAEAYAKNIGGIHQYASEAGDVSTLIDNTGYLGILAEASAFASNDTANALANVSHAIGQTANSDVDNEGALARIYNDGMLDIRASAFASNTDGGAAYAKAYNKAGIYQKAEDGLTSLAEIDNDDSLYIVAEATVFASNYGDAFASVEDAIEQYAKGDGDPGKTATARITNTSDLTLRIAAYASAVVQNGNAVADAEVSYAIYQKADMADEGYTHISNSGQFEILANADAESYNGNATANADLYYGIEQSANAGVTTDIAEARIDNSGNFFLLATADATAEDTGNADANLDYGIIQNAYDGSWSDAIIDNDGIMRIGAVADAYGDEDDAYAYAEVDYAIDQYAEGGDDLGDVAHAQLLNTNELMIYARASANASDRADAEASLSYGIQQYADYGDQAMVTITNSGYLSIVADAESWGSESGTNNDAYAWLYRGISQSASADGANELAQASLTNTGDLMIAAMANARDYEDARAVATVEDGIFQFAYDGADTNVSLLNEGTLSIDAWAEADANDLAYAYALVEDAIYQSASGDAAGDDATATITNTSDLTLNIRAMATANGSDTGYAYAYVDTAVEQYAYDADNSHVLFDNSGTANIIAQARVYHATAYANATAEVYYGIYQSVTANYSEQSAVAQIDNTGSLYIKADAMASNEGANTANAYARVYDAISQYAYDAADTTAVINNDGSLHILALAEARDADTANADATIEWAIYQSADAGGSPGDVATAELNNTSNFTLDIRGSATARGDLLAYASVDVEEAVSQYAKGGDTAFTIVDNTGTMYIKADANAYAAPSGYADADAVVSMGIYQKANADGTEDLAHTLISNDGELVIEANAYASISVAGTANANATVETGVLQKAVDGDSSIAEIDNDGSFAILADAQATSAVNGNAYAKVDVGAGQIATGNYDLGTDAETILTNTSDFTFRVEADAYADNLDYAYADAYVKIGIGQIAESADEATNLVDNDGAMYVKADAYASGYYTGDAYAKVSGGIWQSAETSGNHLLAQNTVDNSGYLDISAEADAYAKNDGNAYAGADIVDGIYQKASDAEDTRNTVTNSDYLGISADAYAKASFSSGLASAYATVENGIYQKADANGLLSATTLVDNDSEMVISADATASAGDTAVAYARVYNGINQSPDNALNASAEVNNSSYLKITADAYAHASYAYAEATIDYGIRQNPDGLADGTNVASVINTGTLMIRAYATAVGSHISSASQAYAYAYAKGIIQEFVGDYGATSGTAELTNSGYLSIGAFATANWGYTSHIGSTKYAYASVEGYTVRGHEGMTVDLDVSNDGTIDIYAEATVAGSSSPAYAYVSGMIFDAEHLGGSFANDGDINIWADSHETATAIGLNIMAYDASQAELVNRGLMEVAAYGENTSQVNATAILFGNYTFNGFTGLGTQTATFTNHGGWIVAIENSGSLDMRGNVMNSENASYPVTLELQANSQDGYLFGNLQLKDTDNVDVSDGRTWFDGRFNQDDGVNDGNLNILAGGELVFMYNSQLASVSGHAGGFVDELNVDNDGIFGLQIDASPTSPVDPDHPRLDANVANLDGTIKVYAVADLYPAATSSTLFYDNVIDADTRNDTFDQAVSNTPLLSVEDIYDGDENVDLNIKRVPFNIVAGLTPNQNSVASAIEGTYGMLPGTYPEYTALISELFTLDYDQYTNALDQLSGVEYAGQLQFALNSFNLWNTAVNNRLNGGPVNGVSTHGGATFPHGAMGAETGWWARIQGAWGDQDGDGNASGYEYDESSVLFGYDHQFSSTFMAGIAGGWYNPGDLDFDNGNRIKQNGGYQIGAYALYDTGSWYARGTFAYGSWDAEATRLISIGMISGVNRSSYDVDAYSATAEMGYSWHQANYSVTPYGRLGYASADIGNFTETGLTASTLAVDGNEHQLTGTLGVRLSATTEIGGFTVVPELDLGYRFYFDDTTEVTNTLVAGPPGTTFDIDGPERDGAALINLGATAYSGTNWEFSVGYNGELGGDYTQHSGYGKIKFKY